MIYWDVEFAQPLGDLGAAVGTAQPAPRGEVGLVSRGFQPDALQDQSFDLLTNVESFGQPEATVALQRCFVVEVNRETPTLAIDVGDLWHAVP